MLNIIKVTEKDGNQSVDGRDLWEKLGKPQKEFGKWINYHIKEYQLIKNEDFLVFSKKSTKPQGGRPVKEYSLTLGVAKEIAMVSKSEQGRVIRRYLIKCEEVAKEAVRRVHELEKQVSFLMGENTVLKEIVGVSHIDNFQEENENGDVKLLFRRGHYVAHKKTNKNAITMQSCKADMASFNLEIPFTSTITIKL